MVFPLHHIILDASHVTDPSPVLWVPTSQYHFQPSQMGTFSFWFTCLTENRLLVAVIQCGPPPQVHHGKVEGTDHSWGAGVSYSCFHGYQLTAPAVLTCEGNGTWTGDVPQCLREWAAGAAEQVSPLFSLSCRDILQNLCCACVCVTEAVLCGDPGSPGGGYREGNIFSYRSVFWCHQAPSLLDALVYKQRESGRRLPTATLLLQQQF